MDAYVMRDGRIVEPGRHEERVRRGEFYAEMGDDQASWYRR